MIFYSWEANGRLKALTIQKTYVRTADWTCYFVALCETDVASFLNVVQVLLSTKLVDLNSQSTFRRSPIPRAAAKGYQDIVKLLLREGIDINIMDEDGDTPCSKVR
jgi:hypothetical protein